MSICKIGGVIFPRSSMELHQSLQLEVILGML